MNSTTQQFFHNFLLYRPVYQLKPVKGSSKVLDFNYIRPYTYIYIITKQW